MVQLRSPLPAKRQTQRNCEVELYEDCRTRKLLEECKCVPWDVPGFEVGTFKKKTLQNLSQDLPKCDLQGRDCIANKSCLSFECQKSCDGIYADTVLWYKAVDLSTLEKKIQPLLSDYAIFKRNNVRHFRFNATSASTLFGM